MISPVELLVNPYTKIFDSIYLKKVFAIHFNFNFKIHFLHLDLNMTKSVFQGVSYSQKVCGKHGFPNLANSKASQLMFPKHLIECQNKKIAKSKFKSEKSNKNKHKNNVVKK